MTWSGLSPPYATIVADPPWRYSEPGPGRHRDDYVGKPIVYSTLTLDAIKALPVGDLGGDARLFLWITNRYLRHGWDVMESWGFTPTDRVLVWTKKPRCTTPVTTEFVLMGRRGHPARLPWHPTTHFAWPLQSIHSRKPPAFMDLVESWCEPPFVELFARSPRLGWDSWGHGWEEVAS